MRRQCIDSDNKGLPESKIVANFIKVVRTKLLFCLPKIHLLLFAMDCKYMSLIIMAKSFIDL